MHKKYCVHQDTESYHWKQEYLQHTISKTKIGIGKYNSQDVINYYSR